MTDDFNLADALECGELVQSAYRRYDDPKGDFTLLPPYRVERELMVYEDNRPVPFGFICSPATAAKVTLLVAAWTPSALADLPHRPAPLP